eukprot:1920524-Rhodomonas_salina.1
MWGGTETGCSAVLRRVCGEEGMWGGTETGCSAVLRRESLGAVEQGPERASTPVSYTHLTLPTICSV